MVESELEELMSNYKVEYEEPVNNSEDYASGSTITKRAMDTFVASSGTLVGALGAVGCVSMAAESYGVGYTVGTVIYGISAGLATFMTYAFGRGTVRVAQGRDFH